MKDCQFGVSPVNYSDSDSDSEWPHFGKELLPVMVSTTGKIIFSLCYVYLSFFISRSGFEGGIWVLIVPVPGQSLLSIIYI